jgi:hypothetical protein
MHLLERWVGSRLPARWAVGVWLIASCAIGASTAAAGVTVDFGASRPSLEVREVADWVLRTGDAGARAWVIVDKKQARMYVLDGAGRLLGTAPVLLGSARGDDTVPGIGDRPLSQIRPEERTTPAGRFIAEPGVNAQGEDIVWVDYDAAVSMHRVRARVKSERRLQRLASPTPQDNRISYGCINLPRHFYEAVLVPHARAGAVVYVLPEIRTPRDVFGMPEATAPSRPVSAREAGTVRHGLRAVTDGSAFADH